MEEIETVVQDSTEQIQKYLKQSFSASNGLEQKHAEDKLIEHISNDPNFIKNLLVITSNSDIDPKIRESACSFINTSLKIMLSDKDCPSQQKLQWADLFMSAFREPSILLKNKLKLTHALSLIMDSVKDNNVRIDMFTKILEWIQIKDKQFITASLLGLQVMIQSIKETQYLYKIFDAIEVSFCEAASFFYLPLQDLLSAQVQELHPPNISANAQSNIVEALNMLTLWGQTLKKIVSQFRSKEDASHVMLVQKVLTNERIAQTIYNILSLNAYKSSQLEQNQFLKDCMISMTGVEAIDEGLNELQYIVISITRTLLFFTFDKRPKLKVDGNMFFKMLDSLLPFIFSSLLNFCNQSKFRQQMNFHNTIDHSQFIDKLISTMLKIIAESGQQMEFYKLFQQNLQNILVDILFPLASSSEHEIEMMRDNAEEFISVQEDCCHKQAIDCYKSGAYKVIETIVDYIDGGLMQVGTYAINIGNYALNCQSPEEIDKRFPSIIPFKQSVFLNTLPKHILLETAFLIISDIQYKIDEREDLVELLQNMIRDNLYTISNPQLNDIVKCRFCCFMSVYYDKLFWQVQDIPAFEQCVQLIFTFLECNREEQRVVQLSAIEALDTMYFDEEYSQRLVQTLFSAIKTLLKYLPFIDYPRYLDLIYSVTIKFSSIIKDNHEALNNILDGLNQKIFVECDKVQSGETKSTICLNKVMSIMKGICENKNYMPTFIKMIEQKLQEVIEKIKDTRNTNFEDDLLLILLSMIKHSNSLTELTKSMLPLFPKIFQKNSQVLSNMFQALNYVFIHGKEYLKQNQIILQNLTEICVVSLFTELQEGVYCTDSDRAQGAILIQLLIQGFGTELPDQILTTIVTQVVAKLQSQIAKKNDKRNPFFRIRLLGILLLGLACNFNVIQQQLVNSNSLEYIIQQVLNYGTRAQTQYDRKIFIMCISQILVQNPDEFSNEIKNHYTDLLQMTVSILICQQKEEEKKFKKAQKKTNKYNGRGKTANHKKYDRDDSDNQDDSDSNDSDDSDGWGSDSNSDDSKDYGKPNFNSDMTPEQEDALEDQITLNNILNPFKSIDEFNYFKQRIYSIKQQRPQFFQNIVSSIPPKSLTALQSIVSIERVETQIPSDKNNEQNKNVQMIPRKIIKAKRKQNNLQQFAVEDDIQ